MDFPVEAINDKSKWRYELKTTGSCFCGNSNQIEDMLEEIYKIVEEHK